MTDDDVAILKELQRTYEAARNGGPRLYRKGTALSYEGVIEQIERALLGCHQWMEMGQLTRAMEYQLHASTLIELLEVQNCGSVGGYDEGQQPKDRTLLGRYRWVKEWFAINIARQLTEHV
jgi:hypothetical protein